MGVAAKIMKIMQITPNMEIIVFDLRNRQSKGTCKKAKKKKNNDFQLENYAQKKSNDNGYLTKNAENITQIKTV